MWEEIWDLHNEGYEDSRCVVLGTVPLGKC